MSGHHSPEGPSFVKGLHVANCAPEGKYKNNFLFPSLPGHLD